MRWNPKHDVIAFLSIAASVALTWYAYASLPDRVPSHFSLDGTADAYASKDFLLWMGIGLQLLVYVLLTFLTRIDPFWRTLRKRNSVILVFRDITMIFMLFMFIAAFLSARTGRLDMKLFGVGLGLLFVLMGNYLPRLPRNTFVGIRVPWTIASDVVWKRTHIVGGWLFVAGGALICALSLSGLPMHIVLLAVLLPVFVIGCIIYPCTLYHKLQREGGSSTPDI